MRSRSWLSELVWAALGAVCFASACTGSSEELPPAGCIPKTCDDVGATCGTVLDSCGGKLRCGSCPAGLTCGGAGPNRCGSVECTPTTCEQQGARCGFLFDGCGDQLECGKCPASTPCGSAGIPNQCGCVCENPPNAVCYQPVGVCDRDAGRCNYTKAPDDAACGDCHVCKDGECVAAPNSSGCGGDPCKQCKDGACEKGDGNDCVQGQTQECMCSSSASHTSCCGIQTCDNCKWTECGFKPDNNCDWQAGDHWECCGTGAMWHFCLPECVWSDKCEPCTNCGCP